MGQLSANLFHGGDYQLRDAPLAFLGEGDMRRLVVVSNRVAGPDCQVAGGLAVCVLDGLRERGGMWFGWNGETVPDASEIGAACRRCGNAIFVTVPITEDDYQEYYLGYCNGA